MEYYYHVNYNIVWGIYNTELEVDKRGESCYVDTFIQCF